MKHASKTKPLGRGEYQSSSLWFDSLCSYTEKNESTHLSHHDFASVPLRNMFRSIEYYCAVSIFNISCVDFVYIGTIVQCVIM